MICEIRELLDDDVVSAAYRLKNEIGQSPDPENFEFAYSLLKQSARDLLDALDELKRHERAHGCESETRRRS
jgi:hypothetical protein